MLDPSHFSKGFSSPQDPTVGWDWRELRRAIQRETRRFLDVASAEDAAQEALIRAYRHRHRCSEPETPIPWVRSIARREALRLLQRRDPLPYAESQGDPTANPSSPEALAIRHAVRDLNPTDRELVWMRYWDDLTEVEIARRLTMPVGTVKTRLHRARAELKESLA